MADILSLSWVDAFYSVSTKQQRSSQALDQLTWKPLMARSGVTRALIGGGGCIFIYSCSARRISFEMNLISKEIRRAEHEYMNVHPPPPPPQLTL